MPRKNRLARNKINVSTQQFLDIAEIKDDTLIMRDGTLRAVIMVSSINFALKSEDEQSATISAYVSFLNNIDFPIQIVVQSREMNIDEYLLRLKKKEKEQTNELLKIQTREYIQYVSELVSIGRIMNKKFYIVIPYNPLTNKNKSFSRMFVDIFKPIEYVNLKEKRFLQNKAELIRRVENILGGLSSVGLNALPLDTQSLIELYYNTYNPETSKNEKMTDIKDIRVVEK
jgi:hypothetical protein